MRERVRRVQLPRLQHLRQRQVVFIQTGEKHAVVQEVVRVLRLQAGDVLFIPAIEARVAVMGQVNSPGYYPFPETRPLTVLDALSLAGGQNREGDLGKAGIIRFVDGKASVVPIDIDHMLQKKNMAANVSLRPDDVLFIPARGERRFEWRDVLYPLSILSGFGLRVF